MIWLGALGDGDKKLRSAAAEALGSIGCDAVDAVPALVRSLVDTDEEIRNRRC